MAVEVKKVLDAVELRFKGKSLSKDFKKAIATKWAAKIDNDADIDSYIEEREDVILEASTEGDRRATQAAKTTTKEVVKKVTGEEETVEEEPTTEIGKMMKMMEKISGELDTLKAEKTSQSIAERFSKDERLKGIDPKLLKGRYPKTEEEFEAAVEEAAEDLKDFVTDGNQQQQQGRFSSDKPNFKGLNGSGGKNQQQAQEKPEVKEALEHVKAFTDKLPGNQAKATV